LIPQVWLLTCGIPVVMPCLCYHVGELFGEFDMDMRVFWSVLAALAVFGVLVIGWRALERERDREDAVAVMQSISDYAANAAKQGQQAEAQRQLQERQRAWELRQQDENSLASRRLAANQRCVGGVAVQVDGATYTQLGSIQNPVHCSGDYADRPIR
jgi:hypothetical protein